MTSRENILKAIRFERPEYIPMTFSIAEACWYSYEPEALCELIEGHPLLFPGYRYNRPSVKKIIHSGEHQNRFETDQFGVKWEVAIDGIRGVVVEHPLADWKNFQSYKMPELPVFDTDKLKTSVRNNKEKGILTSAGLEHGHTFLRLIDLCGYEKVLLDLYDDDKNMIKLIEMLEEHNAYYIDNYVKADYDMISYPEDLGMQIGPMVSPELFKKHIKPVYERLMKPAKDSDCIVHMHSDGDIRDLVDDLIDDGVEVMNLQDLVNGIDWIKENLKSRCCIELDIDRQNITVFGKPVQIENLIREEVMKLSSVNGGFMMIYGLYPGTPLENVKALMDAMEKYMYYWD